MKCDTCGRESDQVARVVIDQGYNRSMAKPLWNCPECFETKERDRLHKLAEERAVATASGKAEAAA